MATNPTLDPTDPGYAWTDQGPVIQSTGGTFYNCIDPSVTFDASSNLWMSFGSFWSGIYLVRLDADDRSAQHDPHDVPLANDQSRRRATRSKRPIFITTEIITICSSTGAMLRRYWPAPTTFASGRSTTITGPYLDRNNVQYDFQRRHVFLKATGKYIAPGQMGILDEDGASYFGYHYCDANDNGAPTFDLEPLSLDAGRLAGLHQ